MRLSYVTADVFTATPFGGNPLAVVLDAPPGLAGELMQAIATEFNYSETTFVLPPDDPANAARVRIFTPGGEVPFAGHPNVGTAYVLAARAADRGGPTPGLMRFEEVAGLVPVEVLAAGDGGRPVGARLTAPQPLRRGPEVDPAAVAACAALDPADIDTAAHRPLVASVGLPFVVAEVRGRRALARARPDPGGFAAGLPAGVAAVHLYTRDGADEVGADLRCRMFAPGHGVAEDPATGSAAAALVGLLAALAPEPDLTLDLRIAQGLEMGRPSLLEAEALKAGGEVGRIRVGGRCVRVMTGALELPDDLVRS